VDLDPPRQQRLELVNALIRGIEQRAEVVRAVESAQTRDEAIARVSTGLSLSNPLAIAVLDLQLIRLAPYELRRLRAERDQLTAGDH
jgi:DNA gyrase/topoisomerase IV subunit A